MKRILLSAATAVLFIAAAFANPSAPAGAAGFVAASVALSSPSSQPHGGIQPWTLAVVALGLLGALRVRS